MDKKINFSINICCLNSEKYLNETIQSVINQSYENWELILIDNGSDDNTPNIINNFQKMFKNIKSFKENKKGLSNARNLAIKYSSYEWIILLDHDDLMHKDRLKIHYNDIRNNTNKMFFFGDAMFFNNNNTKLYSRFDIARKKDKFDPVRLNLNKIHGYINLTKYGCFIVSSTVCFNKNIIKKIGWFNNKYKFISDYIFFLNVSKFYDIYCSDKIISKWRYHEDQSTNKLKRIYFIELNNLYFSFYFNRKIAFSIKITIFIKNLRLIFSYIKTNTLYM